MRLEKDAKAPPTFLFQNDGHHVGVVVDDGHVQGALQPHGPGVAPLVTRGRTHCLQVGVSPLLKQFRRQPSQAVAAGCVEWGLTLWWGGGQSRRRKEEVGWGMAGIHTHLLEWLTFAP